MLETLKKDKE